MVIRKNEKLSQKSDSLVFLQKDIMNKTLIFLSLILLQFNSYGDLLDENNVPYNYWSDGTIRNIAESDTNAGNASFLFRDYNYETGLYNDSINYKNYSFLAPITIGLKWKINP